jgi:hypothetical protein
MGAANTDEATFANGGEYRVANAFIEIRAAFSGIFEALDGVLVFVRPYRIEGKPGSLLLVFS